MTKNLFQRYLEGTIDISYAAAQAGVTAQVFQASYEAWLASINPCN